MKKLLIISAITLFSAQLFSAQLPESSTKKINIKTLFKDTFAIEGDSGENIEFKINTPNILVRVSIINGKEYIDTDKVKNFLIKYSNIADHTEGYDFSLVDINGDDLSNINGLDIEKLNNQETIYPAIGTTKISPNKLPNKPGNTFIIKKNVMNKQNEEIELEIKITKINDNDYSVSTYQNGSRIFSITRGLNQIKDYIEYYLEKISIEKTGIANIIYDLNKWIVVTKAKNTFSNWTDRMFR